MVRLTPLGLGDSFEMEAARKLPNPFSSRSLLNVILGNSRVECAPNNLCETDSLETSVINSSIENCTEEVAKIVPYNTTNLQTKDSPVWDLDNLDGLKSRYRAKRNCSIIYDNIPEESVVILFEDTNPRKRKMLDENLETMDIDLYGVMNKKKSRTELPDQCCDIDFSVTPRRKFKRLGSVLASPKRFVSKVFMKMRNENNKRTACDDPIQELEDNLPDLTLDDSTAVHNWKRRRCLKL